jgi:hypothetical protein
MFKVQGYGRSLNPDFATEPTGRRERGGSLESEATQSYSFKVLFAFARRLLVLDFSANHR